MQKITTVEKILLDFHPEAENLLFALRKISASFGFVSEKDAKKVAQYFELPLSRVYAVASFFDLIETEKPATLTIRVCSGGNCTVKDSTQIRREIENYFRIKAGDEFNPNVRLKIISCLGLCGKGPIVTVNGKIYERVTRSSIHKILAEWG